MVALFGATAARAEEPRLPRRFFGLGGTAGRASIGGVEEAELLSPAAPAIGEPEGGDCEPDTAGDAGTPVCAGGECWCSCCVGDCGGGGEAAPTLCMGSEGGAAAAAEVAGGAAGAGMSPGFDDRSADGSCARSRGDGVVGGAGAGSGDWSRLIVNGRPEVAARGCPGASAAVVASALACRDLPMRVHSDAV